MAASAEQSGEEFGTSKRLEGLIAPWVSPILGRKLANSTLDGSGDPAARVIERRAALLIRAIDPELAKELQQALVAAHWSLPLIVLRLPSATRLSSRRRDMVLARCVNPPLLLRPVQLQLRGIARALKLLVVFPYFTQ